MSCGPEFKSHSDTYWTHDLFQVNFLLWDKSLPFLEPQFCPLIHGEELNTYLMYLYFGVNEIIYAKNPAQYLTHNSIDDSAYFYD